VALELLLADLDAADLDRPPAWVTAKRIDEWTGSTTWLPVGTTCSIVWVLMSVLLEVVAN
jgi:hypothetical protein